MKPIASVTYLLSLQEVLDRVRSLLAEGKGLIDSCQNIDDSVAVKCSELQRIADKLTQELNDKRTMLARAIELHKRLDMVTLDACKVPYMHIYIYMLNVSTLIF